MALRAAMHRAGAAALTELLRTTAPVEMAVSCRCGHPARYHQMHPKQLELLAGIEVTAKAVERQAEGIGAGIAAREQDQIRRAKQLELPEVCTPGAPVLYIEIDGTVWIWNLADQHVTGAIQIVDLYCARQHLWELSAKLFPNDQRDRKGWMERGLDRLNQGKIDALVKILRELHPANPELAKTVGNEADYFELNAARMRCPGFRAQGLFVGSGVVEACCKTVVATRLKRSGMFWTVYGANAIIALRCCRLSDRFEDCWEARSCAA